MFGHSLFVQGPRNPNFDSFINDRLFLPNDPKKLLELLSRMKAAIFEFEQQIILHGGKYDGGQFSPKILLKPKWCSRFVAMSFGN